MFGRASITVKRIFFTYSRVSHIKKNTLQETETLSFQENNRQNNYHRRLNHLRVVIIQDFKTVIFSCITLNWHPLLFSGE